MAHFRMKFSLAKKNGVVYFETRFYEWKPLHLNDYVSRFCARVALRRSRLRDEAETVELTALV